MRRRVPQLRGGGISDLGFHPVGESPCRFGTRIPARSRHVPARDRHYTSRINRGRKRRASGAGSSAGPAAVRGSQRKFIAFVARFEPEPFVETMSVRTALVCRQLNKGAAARSALGDRPIHHLPTETHVTVIGGDANRFDLSSPCASPGEPRNKRKLERSDCATVENGDDEQLVGIGRSQSCARQIANRLMGWVGNPYRREFASSVQPGQVNGVPPIGFDPAAGFARNQRRCHDDAFPPGFAQLALNSVAARARLIAKPRLAPFRGSLAHGVFNTAGVLATFACSRTSTR